MSRARIGLLIVLGTPVALALVCVVAYLVDSRVHDGQVARNVELGETAVGGLSRADLREVVGSHAEDLLTTPVEIRSGDTTLETTAAALGVSLDTARTVDATLDVGRAGSAAQEPLRWVASFFSDRSATYRIDIDLAAMADTLVALEGERRLPPTEPALSVSDAGVVASPGEPGRGLTAVDVAEAIRQDGVVPGRTITVEVEQVEVQPELDDAAAQAFAQHANDITSGSIEVHAGAQSQVVEATTFRSALQADAATESLTLDEHQVGLYLAALFPSASGNPTGATFTIENGVPVIHPGQAAEICCGEDSAARILTALEEGQSAVTLATTSVTPEQGLAWAQSLGIIELVGEFTTQHACCQARVSNIHRVADMIRGAVIEPGQTFSVNDRTGPRDTANGFLPAPVIIDGEHTSGVGGGVSQFATTIFNAAFFAGLDFGEYQSHSEWISRYPYGREATLFYPQLDLEIINNTPYGVLIWTSYTDTSITVQMWSTRYAVGEQTGQSRSSGCGSVTTQRTRTFVDGHTEVDEVYAYYRCT